MVKADSAAWVASSAAVYHPKAAETDDSHSQDGSLADSLDDSPVNHLPAYFPVAVHLDDFPAATLPGGFLAAIHQVGSPAAHSLGVRY